MWVWVMIFAGHQLLCLQLTVWRRKSTLKQLREGVGLELVEMGIAFQQLHAIKVREEEKEKIESEIRKAVNKRRSD